MGTMRHQNTDLTSNPSLYVVWYCSGVLAIGNIVFIEILFLEIHFYGEKMNLLDGYESV